MYKDALKTLERKFGQPHGVITAHLDKLVNITPVKMHDSIISYSTTVSSLVGVFSSLNCVQDLSRAILLGQAVQTLPPYMKEAWSMHTKAESHGRMKTASGKVKVDENVSNTATKTKTTSEVFAATTSTNQVKSKPKKMHATSGVACEEKHPLWKCPVFRKKTPTERAKLVAENKLLEEQRKPTSRCRRCGKFSQRDYCDAHKRILGQPNNTQQTSCSYTFPTMPQKKYVYGDAITDNTETCDSNSQTTSHAKEIEPEGERTANGHGNNARRYNAATHHAHRLQ